MKNSTLRICVFLSILFISTLCHAQDPVQEWVKFYNGPAETFDEGNSVVYDSQDGTIIVAGRGYDVEGLVNVFVVKYDYLGNVVWDYIWDGPAGFDDTPWDIVVASNGNVYVCGQTKTADGYYDSDMFILALDSSGNYLWEDVYGLIGSYFDIAYEMRLDFDENIYVVGTDNQGETNNLYSGGIVNRYTPAGVLDWTIHHNTATVSDYTDGLAAIDIDINENVVLAGSTTLLNSWYDMACMSYNQAGDQNWINTIAGSLNNVSESFVDVETDIYGNTFVLGHNSTSEWEIAKYNSDGIYQWNYIMEDLSFQQEWGIDYLHSDGLGNIYIGVSAAGDIYLTKLDPDGNQLWQSVWASPSGYSDGFYQLTADLAGNIYIAGRAAMTGSYYDMILLKFDVNGNLVWDVSHDGPAANNDEAHGLVVSPDGSTIYLIGYARGYTSNADLVVIKYAQTVNIDEENLRDLRAYPNPAKDVLTIQSDFSNSNASYIIFNMAGTSCMNGTLGSNQQHIAISDLSSGLYSIVIDGHVERFIKN